MRICYVHFCCQSTPQPQNYSSLWMITYQENWTGYFVLVYIWTELLPWLNNFLVSLVRPKRSLLKVNLCTVSSIKKFWIAKKCHLNLKTFYRMWSKLTTLKYVPLTHICSHSSLRRWMQNTYVLCTEVRWLSKGGSLTRVLELQELLQRFLLEKQSLLAAHFIDPQ